MKYTDPFVLAPGVQLAPVTEFTAEFRRLARARRGDFALSHPRSRKTARVIDARLAALLEEFRSPRTIVDAVVRAAPKSGRGEAKFLDEVFPFLQRLINEGMVVTERTVAAAKLEATYRANDRIAGYRVRSCMHLLQDTELYLARDGRGESVVVKLVRGNRRPLGNIDTEARVLQLLDGSVAPALRESGTWKGRRFIAMEWRPGLGAHLAIAQLRLASAGGPPRRAIGARCVAFADAYARLHERGVVHGDVHEGNALLDGADRVTLLDFGLARIMADPLPARVVRGGYAYYLEPEYALARLAGERPPAATLAADQYSLAAMLYWLITESSYAEFALAGDEAHKQIAAAPMLPFARRGVAPWPAVEAVLARALSKAPGDRHPSMRAFADALRAAVGPDGADTPRASRSRRRAPELTGRFLDEVAGAGADERARLVPAPTASVMHGAAGIAFALYRLALLRDDPALLAVADAWSMDATVRRRRRDAFFDGGELTPAAVRAESLYHGPAGVDVVQSLIAHAMGDFVTMREVTRRLIGIGDRATRCFDFSLGLPGLLNGACLVLETGPPAEAFDSRPLADAADRWAARLVRELAGRADVEHDRRRVNLGIAHGWAGILYSLLRWSRVRGQALPRVVSRRLGELAAAGDRDGNGMRWAWRQPRPDGTIAAGQMPGWCNGSAGMALLWLEAFRVTHDGRHAELAVLAAHDALRDHDQASHTLCCGLPGQAYALLAVARSTDNAEWVGRADVLTERAAFAYGSDGGAPLSLFKGLAGIALLQAEIRDPHHACLPLFEAEGWPPLSRE